MAGLLVAIIVAGVFASGAAFQPSQPHHRRPQKYKGDVVRRENHRRHRSRSPLFGRPPTDPSIIASNWEYLRQTLGTSEAKLKNLSKRKSSILTLEIGVLRDRVRWLTKRLDLSANEMKKIARQQPQILELRPDETLEPKLDYLQTRLLLDDASLRKMMTTAPFVFNSCSVDDNLEPKLDWLQQRLDLNTAAVSRIIQRLPSLLSFSVGDNLKPKLEWLQERLDLDDAAVSHMLQRHPSLFSISVENIEPKLDWFQHHLGLDDAELSKLVQQSPTLLGYNVQTNLEPTLNFYIDGLGFKEEAVALVTRDPSLFGRSLEKRLKPRLEEARDAGIIIDPGCLSRIALYTDERWHSSLDFQKRGLGIKP